MCLRHGKYFPTQLCSPFVMSFLQSCSWTVAIFSRFSILKLTGECMGKKSNLLFIIKWVFLYIPGLYGSAKLTEVESFFGTLEVLPVLGSCSGVSRVKRHKRARGCSSFHLAGAVLCVFLLLPCIHHGSAVKQGKMLESLRLEKTFGITFRSSPNHQYHPINHDPKDAAFPLCFGYSSCVARCLVHSWGFLK